MSYSHSKGLFGGVGIDGAALGRRDSDNEEYYGKGTTVDDILGDHPKVKSAEAEELYALIAQVTAYD